MNSASARHSHKVSAEQLDLLLTFMEEHLEFAAGKQSVYSRYSASKLWRLLAERLNAAAADSAGSHKTPDKWCRYWTDIKSKARKKCAAGRSLEYLSTAEERLLNIANYKNDSSGLSGVSGGAAVSDEEQKPVVEEDMCSEGSGSGRIATDELLAEAAMRTALAAEKQAEAVVHAVDLLRDLVSLLREQSNATSQQHPPHPSHPPQPHQSHEHALALQHQHHHAL